MAAHPAVVSVATHLVSPLSTTIAAPPDGPACISFAQLKHRPLHVGVSRSLPQMAHSRYKHVSWHSGIQKYVVQCKLRGKPIYKAFETEAAAVAYLMKKTRSSEAKLLRSSGPVVMKWSSYMGVSWHRGNQKWIAQHGGKTLGAFKSQEEAALCLSRCRGVPKDSLSKSSKIPRQYAVKRFRMLMPVFQDGLPGDLSSATQHAKDSASMFSAEPVLEFVSILSKYGPFKDSLYAAWRNDCKGKRWQSRVLRIIGKACVAFSNLSCEQIEPWITHCGRNVSHHMGPLPLCRRLRVLVSCSRTSKHALIMGKDTRPVRLAMSFQEKAIACRKLESVRKFMCAIAESRRRGVVRTCSQWCQFTREALSAMKVHKPPALTKGSGYTKLWFIRSLLIASGTQQLQVKDTSVEQFCVAFPDARCWLSIFPKKQLMTKAMAEVGYSGRPELFTMFLCMVGSKGMNFDLAWLQSHLEDFKALQQAVGQEANLTPTPCFCCLSVLHGVEASRG